MSHQQERMKYPGDMEQGFMMDRGDMHMKEQAEWASGEHTLPVSTSRCKKCSYLEFHALPKA